MNVTNVTPDRVQQEEVNRHLDQVARHVDLDDLVVMASARSTPFDEERRKRFENLREINVDPDYVLEEIRRLEERLKGCSEKGGKSAIVQVCISNSPELMQKDDEEGDIDRIIHHVKFEELVLLATKVKTLRSAVSLRIGHRKKLEDPDIDPDVMVNAILSLEQERLYRKVKRRNPKISWDTDHNIEEVIVECEGILTLEAESCTKILDDTRVEHESKDQPERDATFFPPHECTDDEELMQILGCIIDSSDEEEDHGNYEVACSEDEDSICEDDEFALFPATVEDLAELWDDDDDHSPPKAVTTSQNDKVSSDSSQSTEEVSSISSQSKEEQESSQLLMDCDDYCLHEADRTIQKADLSINSSESTNEQEKLEDLLNKLSYKETTEVNIDETPNDVKGEGEILDEVSSIGSDFTIEHGTIEGFSNVSRVFMEQEEADNPSTSSRLTNGKETVEVPESKEAPCSGKETEKTKEPAEPVSLPKDPLDRQDMIAYLANMYGLTQTGIVGAAKGDVHPSQEATQPKSRNKRKWTTTNQATRPKKKVKPMLPDSAASGDDLTIDTDTTEYE